MPGCRRRERRRVQEQQAAVLDERVDAGHQVGPPHVARRAAAGRVDDRDAVRRRVGEDVARARRGRRCRAATMCTSTGRPLRALTMPPTSQPPSSACDDARVAAVLAAASVRQRVEQAQVEGVADVEVVVAVVVVELARARARCWPRSAPRSSRPVLPRLLPSVYCTFSAEAVGRAARQRQHHRVVAVVAAAGLVVDLGVRVLHAGDVAGGVALHDRELADDERRCSPGSGW